MMKPKTLSLALALVFASHGALADERESLEVLRATTTNLIEALVESGVLTREKADAMVKKAQRDAARATAARAAEPPPPGTVRVPYVPQIVRDQIRDEIKQEVMAKAKEERWTDAGPVPSWVDRIKWEGDLRMRFQTDRFDNDNTPTSAYRLLDLPFYAPSATRNVAAGAENAAGYSLGNVVNNVNRWRVRARFGFTAHVSDTVTAGVRLATGNTQDRVSTNQTLGQDFNKYTVLLDRAFIRLDPWKWLTVSGGRIPNPWFSTDLVWDDDLNFEGVAGTVRTDLRDGQLEPFLTAGWFPLRADAPPQAESRALTGVQAGFGLAPDPATHFKFGVAQYVYHNMEARPDPYDAFGNPLPGFGSTAYGSSLRARGNTLVATNSYVFETPATVNDVNWGLASRFKPLAVTASADFAQFDPVHVRLSAEYVRNTAFDRGEIQRRTGLALKDGSDTGYLYRIAVGMPEVVRMGDWVATLTYRYVGSDAVLDAFTDSDFGLGGTNAKGYTLGFKYGLGQGTALGVRYLSSQSIDSPTLLSGDRFGVDSLQVDLSAKF